MSDILIKGMEMPTEAEEAKLIVLFADGHAEEMTHKSFPLLPVPPHGRLIDADALIKELTLDDEDDNSGASLLMAIFLEVLKAAPTIIEAELPIHHGTFAAASKKEALERIIPEEEGE